MFGIVAAKEARVNDYATNNTRQSETNDAPVKPWCAPAPALPPIHPLPTIGVLALDKYGRGGLEQILLGRKKVIIRHEHRPTNPLRRQIDQFSEVC